MYITHEYFTIMYKFKLVYISLAFIYCKPEGIFIFIFLFIKIKKI